MNKSLAFIIQIYQHRNTLHCVIRLLTGIIFCQWHLRKSTEILHRNSHWIFTHSILLEQQSGDGTSLYLPRFQWLYVLGNFSVGSKLWTGSIESSYTQFSIINIHYQRSSLPALIGHDPMGFTGHDPMGFPHTGQGHTTCGRCAPSVSCKAVSASVLPPTTDICCVSMTLSL